MGLQDSWVRVWIFNCGSAFPWAFLLLSYWQSRSGASCVQVRVVLRFLLRLYPLSRVWFISDRFWVRVLLWACPLVSAVRVVRVILIRSWLCVHSYVVRCGELWPVFALRRTRSYGRVVLVLHAERQWYIYFGMTCSKSSRGKASTSVFLAYCLPLVFISTP